MPWLSNSFNHIVSFINSERLKEHGPFTLGYERWANLAPEVVELQSFGHASVSEGGELTIKLINIDGNVLYEKTMTPGATIDSSGSGEHLSSEAEVEPETIVSSNKPTTAVIASPFDKSASPAGSDCMITCCMWAIVMFVCTMTVG